MNMHAIESKDNFKLELDSLLIKIDELIQATRATVGTAAGLPSASATSKVNKLKLFEYKLKEASLALVGMDQAEWEEKKDGLQKDYLLAKEAVVTRKTLG